MVLLAVHHLGVLVHGRAVHLGHLRHRDLVQALEDIESQYGVSSVGQRRLPGQQDRPIAGCRHQVDGGGGKALGCRVGVVAEGALADLIDGDHGVVVGHAVDDLVIDVGGHVTQQMEGSYLVDRVTPVQSKRGDRSSALVERSPPC